MSIVRFWELGSKWQALALAEIPEQAMPVFMDKALETSNRDFFNIHAEAFKTRGCNVSNETATIEFNVRYCGFLANEFDRAVIREDTERISFLLDHVPPRSSAPVMNPTAEASIKALGDYLFYTLKDEALATRLVELRYPLNRIDLEKAGFGSEFKSLLEADLDYAVHALQLDQWHGPLSKPDILFLLSLPPKYLAKVDKTYVNDTIELCLSRSKTSIAKRLVSSQEKTGNMTLADYEDLVVRAIRTENEEMFEYVYRQNDEMDVYDIDLVLLATNYRMFTKYAPRILTYRTKQEANSTNMTDTVAEMINDEPRRVEQRGGY